MVQIVNGTKSPEFLIKTLPTTAQQTYTNMKRMTAAENMLENIFLAAISITADGVFSAE